MPYLHPAKKKFQSDKTVHIKKRNGYVVKQLNYKTIYEGIWADDLKHGFALTSNLAEKKLQILKYQGNWAFNKKCGEGNYHYTNGGYYTGEWKYSKRNGYGSMWYNDGSFYDGDWKDNLKCGLGIFVQINGNRYEGEWKDNKKNGIGSFFLLDTGQIQEGLWENDIAVCTTMRDISFRQTAMYATEYSICQLMPRIDFMTDVLLPRQAKMNGMKS